MRVHEVFSCAPFAAACITLTWSDASLACWQEAADRYRLPVELLVAIARVESNLDPRAVNRSHLHRTGSYDIGLMQINSSHLPQLARWGISEAQLLEPCTNLHVGAWILARSVARHGLSWEAVGAYNAACTQLKGEACTRARVSYARKVAQHLPSSLANRPSLLPGGRP